MANVKKDALSPLVHDDQTDHIVGVKNSDGSEKAFVYTDGSQAMTGNLIFGTSGHGIDFSATANSSGTMTSELLDDYEEGTWTPSITSGVTSPVYASRNGWYVKVGSIVYFQFLMDLLTGTAAGTILRFSGLPFTTSSDLTVGVSGAWWSLNGNGGNGPVALPTLYIPNNSTTIDTYDTDGNAFAGTEFASITSAMRICGMYIAA